METLSYCQLMERCLTAEARVVELAAENVALKAAIAEEIEVINRGGQRYCVKVNQRRLNHELRISRL